MDFNSQFIVTVRMSAGHSRKQLRTIKATIVFKQKVHFCPVSVGTTAAGISAVVITDVN